MTILAAKEVAAFAYGAGFRGENLITAVAVAHAESGFRTDAIGDVNLTEPGEESVGLWQINWRPSRDKVGGLRDKTLNLQPVHNATAAFAIAEGGNNFHAWSTYTSGAYSKYMSEARLAVQALLASGGGPHMPNTDALSVAPLFGFFPTPTGHGYWQVAKDGSVFAYGDAQYYGHADFPVN